MTTDLHIKMSEFLGTYLKYMPAKTRINVVQKLVIMSRQDDNSFHKTLEDTQAENARLRDALEKIASIKWLCNCSHAIDGRKHSELCALGIIHKALKETE